MWEWGMGNGEWGMGSSFLQPSIPHSLFPTPHSPAPLLRQFYQHAAGGRRMNERHERSSRSDYRLFVDQPRSAGLQFAEFRVDVVDFDAEVVNSGAAFG